MYAPFIINFLSLFPDPGSSLLKRWRSAVTTSKVTATMDPTAVSSTLEGGSVVVEMFSDKPQTLSHREGSSNSFSKYSPF